MQKVRSAILYLSAAIGIWVSVSFAGAVLNSANASLWSQSLLWSLLSLLVILPALVVVNHAAFQGPASEPPPDSDAQKPFVDEDAEDLDTIWPEGDTEWPHTQEESSGPAA